MNFKEISILILVMACIVGFAILVVTKSYETQEKQANEEQAFINKMNSEKCRLTEVIAANGYFENPQYKYKCQDKSYTLNADISDKLTNK